MSEADLRIVAQVLLERKELAQVHSYIEGGLCVCVRMWHVFIVAFSHDL